MLNIDSFNQHRSDWDKYSKEHGLLFQGLIYLNKCKTILELGVATAETTKHLCQAAILTGGTVYGYDVWDIHGLSKQFSANCSIEVCNNYLSSLGYNNFELTKIDLSTKEFAELCKTKHPSIDFVFIDGCHSYDGVSNDFWAIYPHLSQGGIVAFHDTLICDGCREFITDLRTKYNDGTYDIVEFPYANSEDRTGVSVLVKRSFALLQDKFPPRAVCNLENRNEMILKKEFDWYNKEIINAPNSLDNN